MISSQLPPLNAVKAFDAVCRDGSVSAAARSLHVSQSSVSRHIAQLEGFLGCRLFERTTSGVRPTNEGKEFYAVVEPALTGLRDLVGRMRARHAGVRVLRVSSLSSFALRWLTPRVRGFQESSNGVLLDIKVSDDQPDFTRGECDCAIVAQMVAQPSPRSISLFEETLAVVQAPDSKSGLGPLIHTSTRPDLWQSWADADPEKRSLDTTSGFAFQDFYISIAAAVAGAGVAIVPAFLVVDELAAGTLVEPFSHRLPTGRFYRLLLGSSQAGDPAVQAFSEWLQLEISRA